MPLFAHTETGFCVDVLENETSADYLRRFAEDHTKDWVVIEVPDGTVSGANATTFENPASAVVPAAAPLNPNNPYWPGYVPKSPDQFWGLVQQVFITLQGSNEAGADRFSRLVNSGRAAGVIKIISAVDFINPDDKQGAFLRELAFLTTTKHETDAQFLMTAQEVGAIMQSGNWK